MTDLATKLCGTSAIQAMHKAYVDATRIDVVLTMQRIFVWERWFYEGFTESDLRLVVAHINQMVREKRRRPESLKFSNLIGDAERFGEDLSFARALSRKPSVDPSRASALRSTGRAAEPVQETVRTAAQIIAGMKALEELRALKATL